MKRQGLLIIFGCIVLGVFYIWSVWYEKPVLLAKSNIAHVQEASTTIPIASSTPQAFSIPIFIYHSIRPKIPGESADTDTYDITPEAFETQLQYLKEHHYVPITISQLYTLAEQHIATSTHFVLLTFDDGHLDQYTAAFPLLVKYQMTGTFYVFTHAMDQNPNYMTWTELKEMERAGMDIESHTVTHPYMFSLTQEELTQELVDSKKDLEIHLGHPIYHFASPFGYMDETIAAELKKDGYLSARAIRSAKPITLDTMLDLGGMIASDNLPGFIRQLSQFQ